MPRRVSVYPVRDFTGGINYNADAFQLQDHQSSDALNVDFDPNGGFRRRDGVSLVNSTALASKPRNLWTFITSSGGTSQLVAQRGDTIAYSTGGNFTDVGTGAPFNVTTNGVMYAATVNDLCYIQRNTEQTAVKWDGTTATSIADANGNYNDNLADPTALVGGSASHMPKAKYITKHLNYLFHGNIDEGGTKKRSRVRFSHPYSEVAATATKGMEAYRTNDWIEFAPGDGDEITGIVSWNKELLVFKNNSVWALRGYSPDSFSVENVSMKTGAVGQRAIAVGDEGVYFFSWPNGLQLYDGKAVRDLWYPMTPLTAPRGNGTLIDNLTVDPNSHSGITVGYVNQRCWVSLPETTATSNTFTMVYDPRLGKSGGWTRYDLTLGAYVTYHPPGGDRSWYAVNDASATGYVVKLHGSSNFYDVLTNAGNSAVESWCFTKWFDLGNPALVKRWRHPIFVVDAANPGTLNVDVYNDYDFSGAARSFQVVVENPDAGSTWGGSTWGGTTWSSATFASAQSIETGGLLGRGTAIALKVTGPTDGNIPWAINSITFKYLPKKIRS